MISSQSLSFPVACGLDDEGIETLGAFAGIRQDKTYIQPAEFILNPEGEVAASMYSTTQLGRMKPAEVIQFLKSRVG